MSYLCSLAQMQTETGEYAAENDAPQLKMIRDISARIEAELSYRAEPHIRTGYRDATATSITNLGLTLWLGEPLLAITTITLGSGTVLTTDDYILTTGEYGSPIVGITLKRSTGYRWRQYTGDPTNAISIEGVWGYHNRYAAAFADTTALNMPSNISSSATAFTVDSSTSLSPGHLVKIDSEYIRVLTVPTATTFTGTRGENGSTAASHLDNAAVSVWQWDERVNDAAIRWAGYRYARKGGFDTVTYDGVVTTATPESVPGDVRDTLHRMPSFGLPVPVSG